MNRSSIWLPLIAAIGVACLGLGIYSLFRKPQAPSQTAQAVAQTTQFISKTLDIPANTKWFDTGIDVTGKRVRIKFQGGQWTNEKGQNAIYSDCMGNGSWPGLIVYNAPFRALVGKTDNGTFFVGSDYEVSNSRGKLYLSINDTDTFNDNAGALTVLITAQ